MSEGKPVISVIMCTYNRPILLQRAVDSIMAQTFQDFELIIISDGSDEPISLAYPPSQAIVREVNLEHQGQPRALSVGVQIANADLITFLDDDDVSYTHSLSSMVEAISKSKADMIYFPVEVPGHAVMGAFPWTKEEVVAKGNCPPNLGTVIRKSAFDKVGLYDERCPVFWDWEWMLRAFYGNLHVEQGSGTAGEYYVYPDSVVRKRGTLVFHNSIRERATGKRTSELTLVVPSYNYPQYMPRLIEAMYNQTCPNWKLIIVDDASEKDFQTELRKWGQRKDIEVKLHRKNKGTCATIAEGLAMVKTAYCTVIDADNALEPDYVRQMIDYLDSHPDVVGVHCAFNQYIDMEPTGKMIGKAPITLENSLTQPPGTCLAAWRTEVALKALPEFELCPDWDMMMRGVEQGPVGYINEPLLKWEDHHDSRWWWDVEKSKADGETCLAEAVERRAKCQSKH